MPPSGRKASSSISPKDLFGEEPSASKKGRGGSSRKGGKAARSGPAITLTVESGSHAGKQVTLTATGTIGRSSKCELCLRGAPGVSRRHAVVELRGVTYFIKDAESRNGIVVNGIEIADETALMNGDLIELSDEHIRVRLTAQPAAEPAPTSTARIESPLGSENIETHPEERVGGSRPERPQRAPLGLEQAAALLADGDESANAALRRDKLEAPFSGAALPAPVVGSASVPPAAAPLSAPYAPAPGIPELPESALEPMLSMSGARLEPIGLPEPAASLPPLPPPPAYEDEPVYTSPSAELAPGKRRGSALMFFVGSGVGLTLALLAVGAWDAFMNDGKLRDELHAKANAHLRPHGVTLPTFDELVKKLSGEGGDEGEGEGVSSVSPARDAGPPSTDPPPSLEPVTVAAKSAGRVVTVMVTAGATVKTGQNLAVMAVGTKADLEKKDRLDQEIQKTEKLAKKRGKRGAKAKRQLKALKGEARDLQRGLRTDVVTAPQAATVKAVSVKPKDYVDAGGALLELTPLP